MRCLYRTSRNSFAQLTPSQHDKWRQLSNWRTSTSLCIEGSAAFKINGKRSTVEIERYARKRIGHESSMHIAKSALGISLAYNDPYGRQASWYLLGFFYMLRIPMEDSYNSRVFTVCIGICRAEMEIINIVRWVILCHNVIFSWKGPILVSRICDTGKCLQHFLQMLY